MKKLKYIRSLLLILILIYFAQGSLYEGGSIISQSILLLIFIISGFFLIKTLKQKNKKNTFYKLWTALLLLNIVGFVFTGSISNPLHFGMFKGILITSLTFYPFFYFAQQGVLKAKHLIRFFIVMLPITILQYYFNADKILLDRISGNEELVNNVSYSFVALIPFVFLFKQKKIYAIASMIILMFFIVQGGKRGAFIAGCIGLVVFFYYQLRTIEGKHKYRTYILVLIALVALGYFAYDIYQNNEFLISRMQKIGEGDSSGRNIIFSNIFYGWYKSDNIFNLLFGYGFAASIDLSGIGYAHNDWLELLSNFGVLGVLIYMILFYTTLKYISNKEWDVDKRLLLLAVVLIWFVSTLVSMSYTSHNGYLQSIILAYLIGNKSYSIN